MYDFIVEEIYILCRNNFNVTRQKKIGEVFLKQKNKFRSDSFDVKKKDFRLEIYEEKQKH